MSTISQRITESVATLEADTITKHAIVNGPAVGDTSVVETDGGSVATMARAIKTILLANPRGAWITATIYALKDAVVQAGIVYICEIAHTSGVFATDLAAGKWAIHQGATLEDLADDSGGALVGYKSPVAGAVARTVEHRLRGLPVQLADFGAVGDGVANDYAALQAAFDAMATATVNENENTIGTLEFEPGKKYKVSQMPVFNAMNCKIKGNRARIFVDGSLGADLEAALKIGTDVTTPRPIHVDFENLFVDANGKATYGLLVVSSISCRYSHVSATGKTAGWFFDGSRAGGTTGTYDVHLIGCTGGVSLTGGTRSGFYFNKGGNVGAYTNFVMVDCRSEVVPQGVRGIGNFNLTIIGGVYESNTSSSLYFDATKVTGIDVFTENASSAYDLTLVNGAIFMPYGTTKVSPKSIDATSRCEQRVEGTLVVMNNGQNDPTGEILVGWLTAGAERMTRLGHSRRANYSDTLLGRNLGDAGGASDQYKTFQESSYAGMEFRYNGVGKRMIVFFASAVAQAAGTPFTPAFRAQINDVGIAGGDAGSSGPTETVESCKSGAPAIVQARRTEVADENTFNDVIVAEIVGAVGVNSSGWSYRAGMRIKGASASSFGRRFKTILMTTNVEEVEALTLHPEGVAQLKNLIVATLTAANLCQGAIAFVTDSNSTTRGNTVAGGGANKVLVMSDGTNWKIV